MDLDSFVLQSDNLGGPGSPACAAMWSTFLYEPKTKVDQKLNPYSEEYCQQQMALYYEISGRGFNQTDNELCPFDLPAHVNAPNPYNHPDPSGLGMHVMRLSKMLHYGKFTRGAKFLDMGCGWGLSSEIIAYHGCTVTAVDINPSFAQLVNERSNISRLPIKAISSSFDDFSTHEKYDAIFFYECLHHSYKTWDLLSRLSNFLTDKGRIILAAEAINEVWWKHWGMRLDPLSIYCIRKYGWFEAGWSLSFVLDMFDRIGFSVHVVEDQNPEIGLILYAQRQGVYQGEEMISGLNMKNVKSDCGGQFCIYSSDFSLKPKFPKDLTELVIQVANFRPVPVKLSVSSGENILTMNMMSGENDIVLQKSFISGSGEIKISSDLWQPSAELGTADKRFLGVHLKSAFYRV